MRYIVNAVGEFVNKYPEQIPFGFPAAGNETLPIFPVRCYTVFKVRKNYDVIIGFHKYGSHFDFMRQSSVNHCHCEERSDVAIRFPFAQTDLTEMLRKLQLWDNGLPHQRARLLRNDSESRTLERR